MRSKIRWFLISMANKIGGSRYFDFGEETTGLIPYKKNLIVLTKNRMYLYNGKTFKRILPKKGTK